MPPLKLIAQTLMRYVVSGFNLDTSAVQGTVGLGSQRGLEVPSLTVTSSTSGDSKRT
jgi:hypothetical protein